MAEQVSGDALPWDPGSRPRNEPSSTSRLDGSYNGRFQEETGLLEGRLVVIHGMMGGFRHSSIKKNDEER